MASADLSVFDVLPFYRYRVDVRFERTLDLPAHRRAVLWRGAFGSVFRSLVCHDVSLDCEACPLRAACPFPRVFAPIIPEGRPQIARLRDPPRPFVLADPHPSAPALAAGEPLGVGLTVVGSAVVDLPYFVVSLRRLGVDGIGASRARFQVDSVRCVDAAGIASDVVFERGSDVVRPSRLALVARDLARPGDGEAHRVRVTFVTPTDVRGGAEGAVDSDAPKAPSFSALVRRARDRASALATFFGSGAFTHDLRAVGDLADGVSLTHAEVRRAELLRTSSRTGQTHSVGGVVGVAIYQGAAIGGLMPWLRLAEALGVGKHATFGNGKIAVEPLR